MKPPKSRKAELGSNATGGEKPHAETAESAEFKMTELGPMPVDWGVKRLGDCGSFSKGAGISRAQANSGRIPAVRYGELYTTHHEYIKVFESFISEDVARCSTRLTRGDIVFACSGETKEEIGKCAAFLGDEVAYAGGDLLILSPKEAYDSKFLAFELNTPFCASQKAAAGQGDAVVHIRQHSLEELIVRIPPTLAEQRKIAEALSDIDELILALGKLIEKKRNIKTGAMQELLTSKTRLPGFKGKWVEKCIGDMTCVVTGATPSTAREDFWGGSIRWMSSGELNYKIVADVEGRITKEGFEACSTHIIPVGCVLIGLAGQGKTRGTAAYNLVEMCTNQSIASILPTSSFHSKFLYYYMDRQYDELRLISAGDGGRGGLTKGDIEKFSIRIPPTLAEQKAIAAVLSDMDAEIAALEADRAKYESIKQGMMQELLTGKTRLM